MVIKERLALFSEVEQKLDKTSVDTALSTTSTNPVQNKVIKEEFGKVLYTDAFNKLGLSVVGGMLCQTYIKEV